MHTRTTTTSNRPRRRLGRTLLAAAVAACALPAAAQAAVLEEAADGTLVYRAAAGESNNLSVSDPQGNRALEIRDLTGLTSRTGLCSQVSTITVRCAIGIRLSEARLGDRDDNFAIGVSDPVVVDGGPGRDSYTASNPGLRSRVEFRGGEDSDSASYSNADRGVRISNDGVANDGRIGFAGDNIGRDVEKLEGSAFGDEITAMGDPTVSFPLQSITGGQGNDTLRDGPGPVVTFFVSPRADGADDIIGGPGDTRLDYTRRTQPVNVTLNFGGADDGEQVEGDEITGSVESVGGGSGDDTLRAPAGSTAAHGFTGGAGDDEIEGADGPDTLNGASGVDTIIANGGNDLVQARDNVGDTVGCGLGTDTAELDPNTLDVASSCENRRVGALRVAPKRQTVRAGEVSRLQLSWRHPRSWRGLRRIELRLVDGDVAAGTVTISPRGRRFKAVGAVKLARRSRLARKGKTVSARLALRLGRSLAGRRLRVEVEAVDTGGGRQLEPRAGSIRVSR